RVFIQGFHERFGVELVSHGDQLEITLSIANVGGTDAHIVDSRCRIYFSKGGLPAQIPYGDPLRQLISKPTSLAVGESRTFSFAENAEMEPSTDGTQPLRQYSDGNWKMYVVGQIQYRDDLGRDRFLGFCRELGSDGRFHPAYDHDYEYE